MRNPVPIYHGPLWWVFAVAGIFLFWIGVMWWILGPEHLFKRRTHHTRYRFRDGRNEPECLDRIECPVCHFDEFVGPLELEAHMHNWHPG